jgi:hypothetical protein
MSCCGDNWLVPGADPNNGGGGGGGTVTAVTGTNAAIVSETSPGVYNVDVIPTRMNDMSGDVILTGGGRGINVFNDYPNNTITFVPELVATTGALTNPSFTYTGPGGLPPNRITVEISSTETFTGRYLVFFQAQFSGPGNSYTVTPNETTLTFSGGANNQANFRFTQEPPPGPPLVVEKTIGISNSFYANFGLVPSNIEVRLQITNAPTFVGSVFFTSGIYTAIKIADV